MKLKIKSISSENLIVIFRQLVIFIFFIILAFLANRFPADTFIAGGDYFQLLNPLDQLNSYIYLWFNQVGQGAFNPLVPSYFFYVIISILDILKFTNASMSSFYIFFVLYFSYLSFYLSFKYFIPGENKYFYMGAGLVYALNSFTINLFNYPWAFTHQYLIYIFIPPLIFFYMHILMEKGMNRKSLIIFLIIFILSIVSYNNIAYLFALALLQFIILLLLLFMKIVFIGKELFLKLIYLSIIYIATFFWFILSFYLSLSSFSSQLSHEMAFGGNSMNIIRDTSNSVLNIFSFNINGFNFHFSPLYLVYAIIFCLLLLKVKKIVKLQMVFLIAFLVFIFLSIRITNPFDLINYQIYSLKIFHFFRSPDKLFVFLPFLYVTLIFLFIRTSNLKQWIKLIIVFFLLLLPYNFYLGNTAKYLTKLNEDGYRYTTSIPDQYKEIFNLINEDRRLNSVISLPYSVDSSINWSNYPKWNFVGHDVLFQLTDKLYISANTYDHPNAQNTLSFKVDNEKKVSKDKLLHDITKYSGGYVFYHNDINPRWIKDSKHIQNLLILLKNEDKLRLIDSNEYFDLYKVNDNSLTPLISSPNSLSFKQVNPTKYKIYLILRGNQDVVFNQSYNTQWKLYLDKNPNNYWCQPLFKYSLFNTTECQSNETFLEGEELSYLIRRPISEETQSMVNDFANKWTIDKNYIINNYPSQYYKINPDGSITIELTMYFKPQSYLYIGMFIDGLLLILGVGYLSFLYIHEKKKKI